MSIPRSQIRHDMIEVGVRLSQILSVPKSTGQVYGLLYLTVGPLSLDDLVEQLGISKASASMATRQLASWAAIRRIWVPGERRDFYEVIDDIGEVTTMLARYIDTAMELARYEILEDDGAYWGEIPVFQGV